MKIRSIVVPVEHAPMARLVQGCRDVAEAVVGVLIDALVVFVRLQTDRVQPRGGVIKVVLKINIKFQSRVSK